MKNVIIYCVLLLVGLSTNVFAQSAATANVGVTIVTPIGLTKSVDMDFGNVTTGIESGGTTILSTNGVRSTTGSVTLPASAGSPRPASFIVTGSGNYTYSISIPSSPITLSGITEGVSIGSFTSTPASTGTLVAGSQTLNIGATLTVPPSAAADTYMNSSDLTITVNYN